MTSRVLSLPAALVAAALVVSGTAIAAPPAMWDSLVRANSKTFDSVYILPGADFRRYTKVILEPTEIAFKKDWQRDYNNTVMGVSGRITSKDMQDAIELARTGFTDVMVKAYQNAGYQVVTGVGEDTLRIRTAMVNIDVSAPDKMIAGRRSTYAGEAGEATLVIEARDSVTGEILGRAADRRLAGDTSSLIRTRMHNRKDFKALFTKWATASAAGLNQLKAMSPQGNIALHKAVEK
jgi:hypothetical protein